MLTVQVSGIDRGLTGDANDDDRRIAAGKHLHDRLMTQLRLYRPEALARAESELLHLVKTKALVATAKTAKQQRNSALTRVATDAANAIALSTNTFTFNFM